ncbi:F-box and leucine-rich repeat protein 4 [Bulinus truncatus]|nr:F-box and leucine-rich repeat protein 4 [Bulinus truncatus]
MARTPEEYNEFHARILRSLKHYTNMQKEGDVSPVADYLIRLEGQEVTDFSSQYGSESSISYVANTSSKLITNVNKTIIHCTDSLSKRTYGPWWRRAPSSTKKYNGTPSEFASEDFIEVLFSESLYPVRIEVYETYNPGAIVRILACDRAGGTDTDNGQIPWVTLWQYPPKPCQQRPRIFAPHLKRINFATNLIRLELNHHFLDYYTELDGIKLIGAKTPPESYIHIYQPVISIHDGYGQEVNLACNETELEDNLYGVVFEIFQIHF